MEKPIVSARGVYYDLNKSPYVYKSPYGDVFRFRSSKKLEIYERDIQAELKRVDALFDRHGLRDFINTKCQDMLYNAMYQAFYRKVER